MKKFSVILLLVGVGIGIAIMVYGPSYIEPLLPGAGAPAKGGIEGQVMDKRLEKDRLLVTLKAPEGAILVTFKKKVPEIDLLVDKGDTVTLKTKTYKPFVNDPGIAMVRKPDQKEVEHAKPELSTPEPSKSEAQKLEPSKPEPAEAGKPAPAEEAAPVSNSAM
ncbi:MAG: hypothetical protein P8Y85_00080 [Nitrospirota bacterium]|jgi:hypothetical protein